MWRTREGSTEPSYAGAPAFLFLGPVRYVSHEGERPMSITWKLDHPVPGDWFQQVKIAAG
jgi:hypothetical protein